MSDMSAPTPIIAPMDRAALTGWMDEQEIGSGPLGDAEPVSGGTQNVMLRLSRGGSHYVLRRGPEHLRKGSNEAMRREMRILAGLAGTDVPHPRLVAACPDEDVLGAAFYLMEPVDGYNASIALSDAALRDPAHRHEMGLAMARSLARIGSVDIVATGLDGVGNADGFLERQVPRWQREADSYAELPGYPGFAIDGAGETAAWLEANRPTTWAPGLMHGDFHAANVMFDHHDPEVAAVVDWEMCTIGDQLLDLGWFLASWPGSHPDLDKVAGALAEAGDLAATDELLEAYAQHCDRDLSHVTWYRVLACFKLGIVLEGTHARACAGQAPKETGDLLHRYAVALFAQAQELMSR